MIKRSREELERARAKWWATVSTGDLDGYLALFAEDAVWVTPELDEIVGRDAIRAWLEPVFAQFDYELTITVADVRVAGNLGIERARFLSRMTPKPPPYRPPSSPGLADGGGVDVPHLTAVPDEPPAEPDEVDGVDESAADPEALVEGEIWGEDTTADTVENAEIPDIPGDSTSDDGGASEGVLFEDAGSLFAQDESRSEVEAPDDDAEPDGGDDEPHEGRYLMYWRWHDEAGWLVHRYADVTGVG